ncbi:PTS fructose transporter subunit IIC [Kineococcus rhizosphaerae]|uniref:PTS system D-fructose-specific IIB component (F1P-forming) (Frc family) /PTS system D-fructose-specific IIC component (F1P-forming) (Frc family) n=1 Tax=Kineococcus rhizosphaerae TaxID=559628 RepID=A0A2T0RB88_9ACTN|nr:fructose-specific PTS transporter subunit EIIC [Kineococcus rhizosphaerae]PRY18419.1 PTS system D-fructose-specific IIB component (F1P-forming) (Frc family) /PTS system D-fructose-specific IIC component (F1P-forming) (Frc family) [Kineococcus rhizosphaerae]
MKFVAITSCPTGIAHTYMAAEALEQAGKAAGHDVQVETQGSAGSAPFDPAVIAAADGVIYAADLEVRDKDRFAGLPFVDVGVKKAVADAPGVVAAAVAAVEAAPKGSPAPAAGPALATKVTANAHVGTRIRQWLMTGVSYMIPFVAAGGIMIALSFLIGGYTINKVTAADLIASFDPTTAHDWAGLLFVLGGSAFGFLVPVLAGFIAFGIADRPGLAPGFVGGTIAVAVGAGFLGGLVAGFLGGFVALGLARLKVPNAVRGVMPVVVIPLVATFITAGAMLVVLGHPLKWLMDELTAGLNSLSGGGIVLLGVILGVMMAADLGGPINKVAYTFATTGLATVATASGQPVELKVMAAVMAAGMTPPLGIALATFVRRNLFTEAERQNGKAAVLLGAFFITEGAIPFAAAAPLRIIPAAMIGSGLTGGLTMAFGNTLRAPHGGIVVFGLVGQPLLYLLAIVIGSVVTAAAVVVLKGLHRKAPEAQSTATAAQPATV